MNSQTNTETTYYHDKIDDKSYFGGFFNLAENNIEAVFEEFCLRIGSPKPNNSLDIPEQYFKDKTSYSDWDQRVTILKEYFPVIEYLDMPTSDESFKNVKKSELENKKRQYFRDSLKSLIKLVLDLRHFYTHYHHSPITIDDKTYALLDTILLKVAQQLRKKKMKNDKTKEFLKKRIQEEFKILKQKKINLTDEKAISNSIFNDAFKHLLYKDSLSKYYQSKLTTEEEEAENKTPLSRSGLVFLLSCFLSKKETELLKSNTYGFKAKVLNKEESVDRKHNSLKFMATQWVFSYLSFKGLKHRLSNQYSHLTLLTQMIDELSKVPNEVYQTFSEKDKEEFLEDMNEYVQAPDNEANTLSGATVVHPVIRKRYENKFAYFAIRFLDEFAEFPSLKFQIYSGNFQHNQQDKTIKGSHFISDRIIKERINVFGQLSEVVKYKNDFFEKKEETNWELFPNPTYNVIANNIHIYLSLDDQSLEKKIKATRDALNPKTRGKKKATKLEIINKIYAQNKSISYQEPTALLSLNELNALLYEFLINKKTGQELEAIITKKLKEQVKLIQNYMPGDEAPNSQIPKKLTKTSENNKNYNLDKLLRAIDNEVKLTEEKLELLKNNEQELKDKKRKYLFYSKEKGKEASWIADDLLKWMPKSVKENWKGYQHSELQRLLAFYDTERTSVRTLLGSDPTKHDFPLWGLNLEAAFNKAKFEFFYHEYFIARQKKLNDLRTSINDYKEDSKVLNKVLRDVITIFKKRLFVINNLEKQKKELLAKPIAMPRGIFDPKPSFVKGEKIETAPHLFADWYQYCYRSSHQFQKFYDMPRDYIRLFGKQKLEKTSFKENNKQLCDDKALQLFKMKQDLRIKKQKHQDLFIKLMADYLFETAFSPDTKFEFTLNDLYETKSKRKENQAKASSQKERLPNDFSENVFNNNFVWNKTIRYSLFGEQLIEEKIKLKNIGKINSLKKDCRVWEILSYDKNKIWRKSGLDDELHNKEESYERIRQNYLLKSVQSLEKNILDSFPSNNGKHPQDLEVNGKPNFRMYIANGIIKQIDGINKPDLNWLVNLPDFRKVKLEELLTKDLNIQKAFLMILIRNKFGHNQLPCKDFYHWMTEILKKEKNESYAKYFYRVFECLKEELCLKSKIEIKKE